VKKRRHNSTRSQKDEANLSRSGEGDFESDDTSSEHNCDQSDSQCVTSSTNDLEFSKSVIEQAQLLLEVTEGRKFSSDEAIAHLRKIMRQRSLDKP